MAATLLNLGSRLPALGMGAPFFFSSFLFALSSIITHAAFSFWAPPPCPEDDGIEGEPLVGIAAAKPGDKEPETCTGDGDESDSDGNDNGDDAGNWAGVRRSTALAVRTVHV